MAFTTYLSQQLIQMVISGVPFTPPSTLYLGLSGTTPSRQQGTSQPYWNFTEPVGNGYARIAVPATTGYWVPVSGEPANGFEMQNNVSLSFGPSTGPWLGGSAILYVGTFDASIGGNLLDFAALELATDEPLIVSGAGAAPMFLPSGLTFSLYS